MSRVIHFEITADDPARAARFYGEVFSWDVRKWDGPEDYWLASTGSGAGIDGAIMWRGHDQAVVNTVSVDDLDAVLNKVQQAGGSLVGERHHIPGVGYLHYARDTEGNVFGMMQSAPD